MTYNPLARTPRGYRRAFKRGIEHAVGDDVIRDGEVTAWQRSLDDDERILSQLPPHWAQFSASERTATHHSPL